MRCTQPAFILENTVDHLLFNYLIQCQFCVSSCQNMLFGEKHQGKTSHMFGTGLLETVMLGVVAQAWGLSTPQQGR